MNHLGPAYDADAQKIAEAAQAYALLVAAAYEMGAEAARSS